MKTVLFQNKIYPVEDFRFKVETLDGKKKIIFGDMLDITTSGNLEIDLLTNNEMKVSINENN